MSIRNTLDRPFIDILTNNKYVWNDDTSQETFLKRLESMLTPNEHRYFHVVVLRYGLRGTKPLTFRELTELLSSTGTPTANATHRLNTALSHWRKHFHRLSEGLTTPRPPRPSFRELNRIRNESLRLRRKGHNLNHTTLTPEKSPRTTKQNLLTHTSTKR